jgi:hypothetical protein
LTDGPTRGTRQGFRLSKRPDRQPIPCPQPLQRIP